MGGKKMNNKIKMELKKDRQERRGVNMRYEMLRSMFAFACVMALGILLYGCGKSENAVTGPVSNDLLSGAANTSEFESKAPEEISDNTDDDLNNTGGASGGNTGDAEYKTAFSDGTDIAASGATFLDMATCAGTSCHKSIYTTYMQTRHGSAWTRKVSTFDTYAAAGRKYCVNCHTVNGNFYDADHDYKYTAGTDKAKFGIAPTDYQSEISATNLPSVLFNTSTGKYKEYGGIQCENCHGPASLHSDSSGNRKDTAAALKILKGKTSTLSYGGPAGKAVICASCHSQFKEWKKSLHAIAGLMKDNNPAEHGFENAIGTSGNSSCASCHTGEGFITAVTASYEPKDYTSNKKDATSYGNINCVTCHDPHKKTGNEAQLRVSKEELCMKCHNQRYSTGAYLGTASGTGSGTRLMHQPIREMFLGGTAQTGEAAYNSSGSTFTNGPSMGPGTSCVSCHMYSKTDRAAGIEWLGHTFNPRVEACQECHSGMDAKAMIKMKQTKWKKRFEELNTKMTSLKDKFEAQIQSDKGDAAYSLYPSATYTTKRCGKPLKDGYTEYSAWAKKCAYAEFNLWFTEEEHSKGVHNGPYTEKIFDETEKLLTWLEANAMK